MDRDDDLGAAIGVLSMQLGELVRYVAMLGSLAEQQGGHPSGSMAEKEYALVRDGLRKLNARVRHVAREFAPG